jgi:hypothetical protein
LPTKEYTHYAIGVAVALLLLESDTVTRPRIRKLFPKGGNHGDGKGNRITKQLMRAYQILELHDYIGRQPDLSIEILDRQGLQKLAIQEFSNLPKLQNALGVLQRAAEQEASYRDNPVWARLDKEAQAVLAALM